MATSCAFSGPTYAGCVAHSSLHLVQDPTGGGCTGYVALAVDCHCSDRAHLSPMGSAELCLNYFICILKNTLSIISNLVAKLYVSKPLESFVPPRHSASTELIPNHNLIAQKRGKQKMLTIRSKVTLLAVPASQAVASKPGPTKLTTRDGWNLQQRFLPHYWHFQLHGIYYCFCE